MAGTKDGGKAAAKTNKSLYGDDWYREIGRRGGQNGKGPDYKAGFAAGEFGRARARIYGSIGGKKSKRVYSEADKQAFSERMKAYWANRKQQSAS